MDTAKRKKLIEDRLEEWKEEEKKSKPVVSIEIVKKVILALEEELELIADKEGDANHGL